MSQHSIGGGGAGEDEFQVSPTDNVEAGGRTARHFVITIQAECLESVAENLRRSQWVPPSEPGNTKIRYLVMQEEIGRETGRRHWQGYVQFSSPVRAAGVRKALKCDFAWVKPSRGTPDQCRAYCTKDDTRAPDGRRVEWGQMAAETQGKRNDLTAVAELIKSGSSIADVAMEHAETFMRYHGGITRFAAIARSAGASTAMRPDLEVVVVFGPPGSGKSKAVWDRFPDAYTLTVNPGGQLWWDGYESQETVLIDDFSGAGIPYRTLLRYLDVYPMQVQFKGGMVWLAYKRIFITTNRFYAEWYAESDQRDLAALQRRITELIYMPALGAEPQVWHRGDRALPETWVPMENPVPVPQHAPGFFAPQS